MNYYYIVYILLICALIYRILKYPTFFNKRDISIKISKKMNLKIKIEIFLFLFSILIVFGNIKILDIVIIVLLFLIILTFFKLEKRDDKDNVSHL